MAGNTKIKTVETLEELLMQDLAWRKKEMFSLKILVEKDEVNEPILRWHHQERGERLPAESGRAARPVLIDERGSTEHVEGCV